MLARAPLAVKRRPAQEDGSISRMVSRWPGCEARDLPERAAPCTQRMGGAPSLWHLLKCLFTCMMYKAVIKKII